MLFGNSVTVIYVEFKSNGKWEIFYIVVLYTGRDQYTSKQQCILEGANIALQIFALLMDSQATFLKGEYK